MPARRSRIFAGTSGWAYATWKPGFYPKEVAARRFLQHYGERLNSVEVNYTFRKLPTEAQLGEWLLATPKDFWFSFKAPEAITHRKRLRDCGAAVAAFLDALEPARAAKKLGLLLFQLPPNFRPDIQKLDAFLSLEEMRRAERVSFEFRHEGWFTPECFALLKRHGVALCIAQSENLETPEVHTARGFASFRLRMPGGYSPAEAAEHAKRFQALAAKGRDVYVYYKHEDEPTGPLAAEAMLRAMAVGQ